VKRKFIFNSGEIPSLRQRRVITFAYGRVSSRIGSSGLSRQEQSIEIQDAAFREYIREAQIPPESLPPENIFLERHTGAFEFGDVRKRPEGRRLWDSIAATRKENQDAKINLLVTKIDRIGRGWLDTQIMLRDLREQLKVHLHVINLGGKSFDCDSFIGQKILADLAWMAEMEVRNTQSRILEAVDAKRARGELLNGCAPYGWDAVPTGEVRVNKGGKPVVIYQLEPNEEEQKWILKMLELRRAGWGYRRIATWLNSPNGGRTARCPTKRGVVSIRLHGQTIQTCGKWNFGSVAKVLNNKTTQSWLCQQCEPSPAA
jgi:DNA invertase Pin-like site-specific DNA recombinase